MTAVRVNALKSNAPSHHQIISCSSIFYLERLLQCLSSRLPPSISSVTFLLFPNHKAIMRTTVANGNKVTRTAGFHAAKLCCCWVLLLCMAANVSGYVVTTAERRVFGGSLLSQRGNNNQHHIVARSRTSTLPLWQHDHLRTELDLAQRRRSLPGVSRIRNRVSKWMQSRSKQSNVSSTSRRRYRRICLAFASLAMSLAVKPTIAVAMGAMGGSKGPVAPVSRKDALSLFGVFFALFLGLALLHAAEIAITTLYPWKVREFAEEVSFEPFSRHDGDFDFV